MNRDDVIRMAREAGAVCMFPPQLELDGEWVFSDGDIERLANLIASHVTEECAKKVDSLSLGFHSPNEYSEDCADAIRSLYKITA